MLFTITAISFLPMEILYTVLFTLMLYGVIKMLYVFFHILIFIVIAPESDFSCSSFAYKMCVDVENNKNNIPPIRRSVRPAVDKHGK